MAKKKSIKSAKRVAKKKKAVKKQKAVGKKKAKKVKALPAKAVKKESAGVNLGNPILDEEIDDLELDDVPEIEDEEHDEDFGI